MVTSAERHARAQLHGVRETDYSRAALGLLVESGCTVRRWRKTLSGVAFCDDGDYGIEAPEPTTPLRFGIFAHEVGHQDLHRGTSLPRWLEEVQAWEFALDAFSRFELPNRTTAETRAASSIGYAFEKALLRGVSPSVFYANAEARWWADLVDVRQLAEDIRNGGAS